MGRSSKLLLRRLKLPLSKRRIRFSGLNLSLDKSARRLTVASRRRRRSLKTLAKTINAPWTLWLLPWRPNNVPRVKLFASRRNLNLTSTNLKLLSIMPTRPTLRVKRPSSVTKDNSVTPFKAMKNKPVVVKKSWRPLALPNARPMLSAERLKSLVLFSTLLIVASVNWMLSWLTPAMLSMRCKSSTPRPCMRRGLESVIHTLQAEIDDALQQAKNSEEKSKRAMVDAARLADELRAEQDHVQTEARAKRALDTQLGELEVRLTDAEANAMKGGKNAMAKLEMRIRELEMELGSVQSRTGESYKAFQRAERRVKELQFQQEEDRKNQDRMSDLANKLQQKIKTYKQQIEEAEEIAALNLAKYRKGQQELEETEERAKMAGVHLETLR